MSNVLLLIVSFYEEGGWWEYSRMLFAHILACVLPTVLARIHWNASKSDLLDKRHSYFSDSG